MLFQMNRFRLPVVLFFFINLRLSVFSQSGNSINFEDYIPSGCSNEPLLTIGLIADPQYCDCDPSGTRYYRETMWKLPQAIDTMNKYQVDFVMSLGDMIDRYYESYDSVSKHYKNLNMPFYNLLGNHEFEEVADELKSSIVSRYGMPGYYYSYVYNDWRFLVLDGTELAAYTRYIHPDLAEEGDSVWNSVQGMINGLSWNGGISKAQQAWMRSEIEQAADSGQNVIVFCHFPVYPDSVDLNLWNKDEIITLLEQYPNVAAYINGHLHEGNYGYRNNIHYYTQAAMLDTPDSTAFSIMRIYPREILIQGFGRVPDRTLPYDSFKKKTLQIFLSDTLLHYSHLKNDLTGYLSFVSPESGILINYVLDTAIYHNRYFRINNDSLILNIAEDLSVIPDLKINVIAVDCDADTFSQNFALLFDTTVMTFRYQLPDTVISVYSDYRIPVDSLLEDYSKYGMDISLSAMPAGVVTYTVTDDTVKVAPYRVGSAEITLTASDQFTGMSFHQTFGIEVFDPLNHAPNHKDSTVTDYIVQLNDISVIQLGDIFFDPDADSLFFSYTISDPTILEASLFSDTLQILGIKPGKSHIELVADDNHGGADTLTLHLFINTGPARSRAYATILYQFSSECTGILLDTLFFDPDGDTIEYQVSALMDSAYIDKAGHLILCPKNAGVYKIYLSLADMKGGFFEDSLEIRFNASPEAVQKQYEITYQQALEQIPIDLRDIFTDTDNDILSYVVSGTLTDTLNYSILDDVVHLYPQVIDTFDFFIIASDPYGAKDSARIRLVYIPESASVISSRLINDLKIFPNPASGIIRIQYESVTDGSIGICLSDQTGRIVYQSDNLKASRGVNLYEIKIESNKAKGLYLLMLYMSDEQFIMKNILLE
jgi:hypothetical protein